MHSDGLVRNDDGYGAHAHNAIHFYGHLPGHNEVFEDRER